MKYLHALGISALSLVMLAACNQQTQSSVGDIPAATPTASATAPTATAAVQKLTSANGKLSLETTGQFTDQLAQANQLISDIPTEQLLLLQNDTSNDVLIYAADLGAAKADANTYLAKLSDSVKADAKLQQVVVGSVQNNKLAYQFSETVGENTINQACQAVHQQNIYSVCAISTTQNPEALASAIQNISVQ
ncbi:hypothetical protein [Vitreoscilla stercoraria]|uniref:Lipoprotein n=1 Tax=Vitreoscilla stercoraria TaxID=61 RepID=A0ABY4E8J0_VITST|nr:hypothetical protein [Vitreoscilla stercoraria]UOO92078.1 hypothetical protein LVJ81_10665 [Vitreoscilla stercoraria]